MNKSLFKKLCFLAVVLSMCFTSIPQISLAASNSSLSLAQINKLQKEVTSYNDKQFDDFLVNYVSNGKKSGKSFSVIKDELSQVGVSVSLQNSAITSKSTSASAPLVATTSYGFNNLGMVSPSDHSIMIVHRGHDTYYRIIAYIDLWQMSTAATQDCLSVEWDYDDATYYSTNCGSNVTYRDGSNKFNGIVLFNYNDYGNTSLTYAAVYVTPVHATSDFNYASKLEHTWDYETVTWSEALNIQFTTAGAGTLGYTFTRSGSSTGYSQSFYTDNNSSIQVY